MTPHRRRELLFIAAAVLAGAAFTGGYRYGDTTMRDPGAFITMIIMIAAFGAVLYLGGGA